MSDADVGNDVEYDVVIVGSGAGGGMAAYQLTKAGLKCLVLEAGDWYDTAKDSKWLQWGYDAAHRGASRGASGSAQTAVGFDAVVGGWKVEGEPYTCAPGSEWKWYRSRMLGGRTNSWGRIALRNGPYDFKPHSRDGKGFDWPIGYEDLAPYYDRTEELIGVFGSAEGMENLPDGKYQPPPAPRCYERLVQKACETLKIPCIPSRLAILTQPKGGRPACHYVAQCQRGCRMGSNFSSPAVLLYPALQTGNLEIRCNAMVREVRTGKDGLATGVSYVDKKSGDMVEVRGRAVVLAASACETARLLLNSRGAEGVGGLANSSGMVGKYLMDTVMSDVTGWVPAMMDLPAHNEDGVGGMHLYMPWWKYKEQARGEMAFSRGYHIEFNGGRRGMPGPGLLSGAEGLLGGGYGAALKEKSRRLYGSFVSFHGRGEMIPNEQSYCEIDEKAVDQWGIPVLKFHFAWGEEERQMARHMQETSQAIVKAMGGTVIESYGAEEGWGIAAGGEGIHEVGGARMGSDPKTSVVNAHGQAWDCRNLFVADGSPFVSLAEKNPTLTILALAWRTSEYIAAQMRPRSS
jgi:choline dehydrogenase-like flavoprotein